MNRPKRLCLFFLLAITLLARLPHIRSDPPRLLADLSGSAGIFFDEGHYPHNARNKILFDRWIMDEWNPVVYNAPLTGLYYLAFRIGGVRVETMKAVNILFGCLGVFFFFLIVSRRLTISLAGLISIAFSLNYYWLNYNRLGLLENFNAFLFLAIFALFDRTDRQRSRFFWLGILTGTAILSKYLFFFFFLAVLAAVVLTSWQKKEKKLTIWFLAGFLMVLVTWTALIFFPFHHLIRKIGGGWGMLSLPGSLSQIWRNIRLQPLFHFMMLMPVAFITAIVFSGLQGAALVRSGWRRIEPTNWLVLIWLWGGFAVMAILNYRPMRYYLPMVPAVFLASAFYFTEINERKHIENRLLVFGSTLLFCILAVPFFQGLGQNHSLFPFWIRLLIWMAVPAVLALPFIARTSWLGWAKPLLTVVCILVSFHLYLVHFYRHPTYRLETAATYLSHLPANSIILGQESTRLALETPFQTVLSYEHWFNDQNPFQTYRPTHLLVFDKWGTEYDWITRRFPSWEKRFHRLRQFRIWDSTVTLYQINQP